MVFNHPKGNPFSYSHPNFIFDSLKPMNLNDGKGLYYTVLDFVKVGPYVSIVRASLTSAFITRD
jgi:hypothetical protein